MAEPLEFNTSINLYADLGFYGWKPANINLILPYKKPKNTKEEKRILTIEQKEFNKLHANKRVKVEHSIGNAKILRIVKEINRNYKLGFRATIMRIACALFNFKLSLKCNLSNF